MSIAGAYFMFLFCLGAGLAAVSISMKIVIEQFFTDRGLEDYEFTSRLTMPAWGHTSYYGQHETSLVAVIMRFCAKVPPAHRRVSELQFSMHGD